MLRQFTLYTFLLVLSACSSKVDPKENSKGADFDVLCQSFTAIVEKPEFNSLGSEARAALLSSVLAKKLKPTSNALIAWTAIQNGPPNERYNLFVESADSVGYKGWACPAIKEHGHEVGSTFD